MPKTVQRVELSNFRMVAGNERKYSKVIVDGKLMEWVAIGWIEIRKATKADKAKYPTAVYHKDD